MVDTTRYNTGNELGSNKLEDLSDNAKNIDKFANGGNETFPDRFGVVRKSIAGMESDHVDQINAHEIEHDNQIVRHESEFITHIEGMGLTPAAGSFQAGGTITDRNQTLYDEVSHVFYAWGGALPKVVAAGSTPATAGGTGVGAWSDKTDLMLRSDINIVQKRFACVADMVADTSLSVGKIVETIGYYNDWHGNEEAKGGNKYEVVAAGTGTEDGGTFISLNNGLQAKGLFFDGIINVCQFGAKGDALSDDTASIQAAIYFSNANSYKTYIPSGTYRITQTITCNMGSHYSESGTYIYGDGRSSTNIRLNHTTGEVIPIFKPLTGTYNLTVKDVHFSADNEALCDGVIFDNPVSGVIFDQVDISGVRKGVICNDDAWINSWTRMKIDARDIGFSMAKSGTTNHWDGIFVYRTNIMAYDLRGSYSSVGSLAADNCTGIVYSISYFSGFIGALGSEQPESLRCPDKILYTRDSNVSIGYLLTLNPSITHTPFTVIDVLTGDINIDRIEANNTAYSLPSTIKSSGLLYKNYDGILKIGRVDGSMTFSPYTESSTIRAVTIIHNDAGTEIAYSEGKSRPFVGSQSKFIKSLGNFSNESKGVRAKAIYMDAYGSPLAGGDGTVDYQWSSGVSVGDVFLENDPKKAGRLGYVCAVDSGTYIRDQDYLSIPVISSGVLADKPISPVIGQQYYCTGLTTKPILLMWSGSFWADSNGCVDHEAWSIKTSWDDYKGTIDTWFNAWDSAIWSITNRPNGLSQGSICWLSVEVKPFVYSGTKKAITQKITATPSSGQPNYVYVRRLNTVDNVWSDWVQSS